MGSATVVVLRRIVRYVANAAIHAQARRRTKDAAGRRNPNRYRKQHSDGVADALG